MFSGFLRHVTLKSSSCKDPSDQNADDDDDAEVDVDNEDEDMSGKT
jgi:hypothetical protein